MVSFARKKCARENTTFPKQRSIDRTRKPDERFLQKLDCLLRLYIVLNKNTCKSFKTEQLPPLWNYGQKLVHKKPSWQPILTCSYQHWSLLWTSYACVTSFIYSWSDGWTADARYRRRWPTSLTCAKHSSYPRQKWRSGAKVVPR